VAKGKKPISLKKKGPGVLVARDSSLFLKSSPPHVSKGFIDRERLSWSKVTQSSEQIVALMAPTGFGKTSQLVQWRKDASAQGYLTLWYSIDNQDQPLRLARGLTESARVSCTSYGFSDMVVESIRSCSDAQEALTHWLAEIAYISTDILLILDDVHQLPTTTLKEQLPYLLHNAPANLRIALTAQPHGALLATGVLAPGLSGVFNATDLRLRLEETQEVLASMLGDESKPDTAVRVHELTDGWPLGVQLSVAALNRGSELEEPLQKADADLRRYFLERVIDKQPQEITDMLVRLAQFGPIHPDFCCYVLEDNKASERLEVLQNETPLILSNEKEGWLRLHPFVRKILSERLEHLTAEEKGLLAHRASEWYAEQGMFEQAARQSIVAGDSETALDLIERSTQSMTESGRSTSVVSWYERMSPEQLEQHPGFWAPVAWALGMSERFPEVESLVNLILSQPNLPTALEFEASLIMMTAWSRADRFDLIVKELEKWPQMPADAKLGHERIYIVAKASYCSYIGKPEKARQLIESSQDFPQDKWSPVTQGYAEQILAQIYLNGGQFLLAKDLLKTALSKAEADLGRQNPTTCLLAAQLARACWETGESDQAALLLADRITVVERNGFPDTVMEAYFVQSRLADDEGQQDKALSILDSLQALGRARNLVRVQIVAVTELAKLHSRHTRSETAWSAVRQLKALVESVRGNFPAAVVAWSELQLEMVTAGAHLATGNLESAVAKQHAMRALEIATDLKRLADCVESRLLLVEAKGRNDLRSDTSDLNEAYSLAEAHGMTRLLREHQSLSSLRPKTFQKPFAETLSEADSQSSVTVNDTVLLTPKEREVLLFLSRNLSNKEIANAMNIGIETVKWHIKNLSGKLHAGNRKHAVARARMLGLFSG
jgi:LuxR family maltose regulon positive regulatory protein